MDFIYGYDSFTVYTWGLGFREEQVEFGGGKCRISLYILKYGVIFFLNFFYLFIFYFIFFFLFF